MTPRPATLARQALTDAEATPMATPTLSISPGDYNANSTTATFVDYLIEQAGIDKDSCALIELVNGQWEFTIFCCDRTGRIRIDSDGPIAHTEVWAA